MQNGGEKEKGIVINHNLIAINGSRQFNIISRRQAKNMEKLSSGYRINRAADDAAGLAISEKMRRQIRGLRQSIENTQDGVSLCQIADGALNEVHDMLHRLEELSVKAANGTNTESDREAIQKEVDQILSEINRISETSTFNEQRIFSGGTASDTETAQAQTYSAAQEISENNVIQTYSSMQQVAQSNAIQTHGVSVIAETSTVCGGFTVTGGTLGTDYTFENGVLTILKDTAITIQNTNPNVATTDRIEVASGVSANITLAGVNIDVSSKYGNAALKIADNSTGNVTITLADGTNNILKGGSHCAGLQKNGTSGGLTIKGNTGALTAIGGDYGAGIGGGDLGNSGKITISGGKVTAKGGYLGAGIGGGGSGTVATGDSGGGSGSDITISGGIVIAEGGYRAAGIGGGGCAGNAGGSGSNITISDACVSATGGSNAGGIGGGYGGRGSGSSTAPDISDSLVIDGNKGTVTGDVTVDNDFTIDRNVTVEIDEDSSLTVADGATLTNNGTITNDGTMDVYGELVNNGNISGNGTINYHDGDTDDSSSGGSDGSQSGSISGSSKRWWIQCGSESGVGMFVEIGSIDTVTLGIHVMNVTTQESADKAILMISGALEKVSSVRSRIGAQQNRLEHTIANEMNIVENTTAAESLIRDADMAKEMLGLSTANILAQAGISVLAQANTSNEEVLMLLR